MIQIKTKTKISLAQALTFAEEQKNRGIRINEMFSDDCKWLLEVTDTTYTVDQFKANVRWYQLVEYETGEGISEMQQLIYSENFTLGATEIQQLWEGLEGSILHTDNYLDKVQHFTTQGILVWCGTVRNIFGVGVGGFEIV